MQKPSKKGNFRRISLQLGVIALVLIAWRLIYLAQQPERIELPKGILLPRFIKNGETLWITQDQGNYMILAKPLIGGAERIVMKNGPEVITSPLLHTENEVFYQVQPGPKKQAWGTGEGRIGGASMMKSVGTFRPGTNKPVPGEKRSTYRREPSISYQLRRVPLAGGSAKEVGGVEANVSTTIAGEWVYWIKERPEEATSITQGKEMHTEVVGHSDLMATSLKTGETRKLATGLNIEVFLTPGAEGVYWIEPRAFPDPAMDLYYASAATPRTLAVPDFQINASSVASSVIEYQGRLYWVRFKNGPSDIVGIPAYLLSARPDGSDRKIVLDLDKEHQRIFGPMVYQGSLYCVMYRVSPLELRRIQPTLQSVCRLHPERANPLEVIRSLEKDAGIDVIFDDGYCYYSRTKIIRPLWDILTGDETNMKQDFQFYRFRLPH